MIARIETPVRCREGEALEGFMRGDMLQKARILSILQIGEFSCSRERSL